MSSKYGGGYNRRPNATIINTDYYILLTMDSVYKRGKKYMMENIF